MGVIMTSKRYTHGRVVHYDDERHHGLSYQHRDDGDGTCPLPERGSHSQGQRHGVEYSKHDTSPSLTAADRKGAQGPM
jgi:hypothetical protein